MAKRLDKKDYISLLEQAVVSGPSTQPPTGVKPGLQYRGMSVDGDEILNWDGKEDQMTHKELKDIDDIVKTVTGKNSTTGTTGGVNKESQVKDDSPLSILEMDEDLAAAEEEKEKEKGKKGGDEEGEEEKELDVDKELEEDCQTVSFSPQESEVLSRLIKEMGELEKEDEEAEDEGEEEEAADLELELED